MALTKYILGDLLVRNTENNEGMQYNADNVRGVLNSKGISNTKVSVDGRDLSKFLVVRPGGFIFNHRVHDKLGLGYGISILLVTSLRLVRSKRYFEFPTMAVQVIC